LAEYAEGSFHPGRPLVEAVLDLTDRVYREFQYEPGFTSIATPLLEVLEQRRGVCQDFAHLMIGCIRSLGLAARYVSGYIETFPPPGQERLVGADASHAWASVYLPGWGWVDVDPTNDQFVAESYITTGWGRDYWDVSPLRGSVEGGGGSHRLDVAVDVTRVVTATADV
jgi:transglutaminase-like putative cysteine protease